MVVKKRGRPKSKATLEREEQYKLFENSRKNPRTGGFEIDQEQANRVEKEILDAYRHHPMIPKSHAYEMASLGDESMDGYEHIVLERDKYYDEKIKQSRLQGAESTSLQADYRAKSVWSKNQDLIGKINKRLIGIDGAAKRIISEWNERGDANRKPSKNTVINWYHRHFKK